MRLTQARRGESKLELSRTGPKKLWEFTGAWPCCLDSDSSLVARAAGKVAGCVVCDNLSALEPKVSAGERMEGQHVLEVASLCVA